MVAFNSIKPGDTLYDCRQQKMGNTTRSTMRTWTVVVKDIDAAGRRALCTWNGNAAKWWDERKLRSLRRSPVQTRKSMTGADVRASK